MSVDVYIDAALAMYNITVVIHPYLVDDTVVSRSMRERDDFARQADTMQ
jgi:hypothetical protein